jgi:hypothetical protein
MGVSIAAITFLGAATVQFPENILDFLRCCGMLGGSQNKLHDDLWHRHRKRLRFSCTRRTREALTYRLRC